MIIDFIPATNINDEHWYIKVRERGIFYPRTHFTNWYWWAHITLFIISVNFIFKNPENLQLFKYEHIFHLYWHIKLDCFKIHLPCMHITRVKSLASHMVLKPERSNPGKQLGISPQKNFLNVKWISVFNDMICLSLD